MKKEKNFDRQIAIIVPVYNAGNKLKACIRSILHQSFKDFSLVLVDDGSTDNSGILCDNYATKDNRILVIHQKNKGSEEARKTGIFTEKAQGAKYLMFCDADDTIPKDGLRILISNAEKYQADCVCGNMRKMIGNILIPHCFIKYVPECFRDGKIQVYNHEEILKKLYVSCFGISNYPVSLWAKLYRTELLTDAVKYDPIVRFMGEDLSITLRIMPNIDKLVIIPNEVYHYRMGGGTSKFMPYMLDDFLALYRWKNELRLQYDMNSDVKTLIDIELMNILVSYLQMCKCQGRYSDEKIREEVVKVINIAEIKTAAISLEERNYVAKWIQEGDLESFVNLVNEYYNQTKWKRTVRKVFRI